MSELVVSNEDHRVEELLLQISADEKYSGCVFWGPGIYFVIVNGKIREISNDAGCSPRGGWFPPIVTGPTDDERACLEEMMRKWKFDADFCCEAIEEIGWFEEDDILEWFEDSEEEDSLKVFRKIQKKVALGTTPFDDVEDLIMTLARLDLDDDLYYEWEGDYIHFYDNICDTGEAPGYYDSIDTKGWIEILENIDRHIVTAGK